MVLLCIIWSDTGAGISRKELSKLLKMSFMPWTESKYSQKRKGYVQLSINCLQNPKPVKGDTFSFSHYKEEDIGDGAQMSNMTWVKQWSKRPVAEMGCELVS